MSSCEMLREALLKVNDMVFRGTVSHLTSSCRRSSWSTICCCQGQVPPHVTTEHMSNWLVSQGKKSLRERWVPRQHSPSLPFPATSSTPGDVGKINNRKIRSQESWNALCFIWRVWKETLEEGNDLARLVREWELETCYKLVSSLPAFQQRVSAAG